jgi:hypothetical protein
MTATFSGSFSAALAFSLSGSPVIGSEGKAVTLSASRALTNGTGANQGQVGWADLVSIPAGQTYLVDLLAAGENVFGLLGLVSFSYVRGLYVENQETSASNYVLVGIASGNDINGYAAWVEGGGTLLWTAPLAGRQITSANRYLTISNPGAAPVAVAVGLYGLGTILDT